MSPLGYVVVAAMTALTATSASSGRQPTAAALAPSCNGGICTLDVDASQAIDPCANAPILLAWSQEGGATLIQCDTNDGWLEKPSLVFDRRKPAGPAYDLQGVTYLDAASLSDAAHGGASDTFASHGACKATKPVQASPGDIPLLRKTPSGNDKDPYCYLVSVAVTTPAGIAIRGSDPDMPKADADHGDWDKLVARMTALIPARPGAPAAAAMAPAGPDAARVVHAKASLRDAPDLASPAHGYLVQGDVVTILDRSHAADGWLQARYVGKNGTAIERWIRAGDLGLAQPAAAAH